MADDDLRGDLADELDPTKGSALVGYNSTLPYADGTVGAAMKVAIPVARATFVSMVSNGFLVPDGTRFVADGLTYISDSTESHIPDLPGWTHDRTFYNVRQYGATGVRDAAVDTPALQAAVQSMVTWVSEVSSRTAAMYFPAGAYRTSQELDFTLDGTTNPSRCTIYGDGSGASEIMGERFGGAKAVLRLNGFGATKELLNTTVYGLTIRQNFSSWQRTAPMGIMMTRNRRCTLRDLDIAAMRCGIYATRTFNSDMDNVRITGGGWQLLRKSVPDAVRFSITSGSTTVVASEPIFDDSDIGQELYIYVTFPIGTGGTETNQRGMVFTMTAVADSTHATISSPAPNTNAATYGCFEKVKFTAENGSQLITLNADVMDPVDVGTLVYLPGAGGNAGQCLHTTITEVVSPRQFRVAYASKRTVDNEFMYLSAALHAGGQPQEIGESQEVNDITGINIHIEQCQGIGLYGGTGIHMFYQNLKVHGIPVDAGNWSRSGQSVFNNRVQSFLLDGCEFEFGCGGIDSGIVKATGNRTSMRLQNVSTSGECHGGYFLDIRCTSPTCMVEVDGWLNRIHWPAMRGAARAEGAPYSFASAVMDNFNGMASPEDMGLAPFAGIERAMQYVVSGPNHAIRFYNGIQICWGWAEFTDTVFTAVGSLARTEDLPITYALPFITSPSPSPTATENGSSGTEPVWVQQIRNTDGTGANIRFLRTSPVTSGLNARARYVTYGRWK